MTSLTQFDLLGVSKILQKTINFNGVTDEFSSVKAEKLHCKFSLVHEKC